MIRLIIVLIVVACFSCEKAEVVAPEVYACSLPAEAQQASHPKATQFQAVINQVPVQGMAGNIGLVSNADGLWLGAAGYADIANNVELQTCNTFLIASVTKLFTATAVMQQVEQGNIDLDATLTGYLSPAILKDVANVEVATIRQVLQHTSGIPDFYDSFQFETSRVNLESNDWTTEEILEYARGRNAYFSPGTDYEYSNTNYLLLGLLLEAVTNKELKAIYQEQIFDPLGMTTAYYDVTQPFPSGLVRGYAEAREGELIESEWLYRDEMGTADGGIAINIYDLYLFADGLFRGNLVQAATLETMLEPIILSDDDSGEVFGHQRNGLGVEIYDTPNGGEGFGHLGGIDGFVSYFMYFPASDAIVIHLQNTASVRYEPRVDAINELTRIMLD